METLMQIGEFGLIHRIRDLVEREGVKAPSVTVGIGDDTASFVPHEGKELLVTCDSMVEGRHFLPQHITPLDLGRRAMALNISDIGAMGGCPLYALVSLGLKADTHVSYIEEMFRGFVAELNPFNASIIGGNLTRSGNGIFIDITLIGEVESGRKVRRSTARTGDVVLVTGYPGESAAGLLLLLRSQLEVDLKAHPLIKAYNRPSHRAKEGEAVGKTGWATAMIDTSDGFLGDLGHICEESRVGARLSYERFPVSDRLRSGAHILGKEPQEFFMGESDDYELIITCHRDHVEEIKSAIGHLFSGPVTEVGAITDIQEGLQLVLPDGTEQQLTPSGWDHFR